MKKIVIVFPIIFLLNSCQKKAEPGEEKSIIHYNTLREVKEALMAKIITIANMSPAFKKAVENECLKQLSGDYDVSLDRILEIDRQVTIIPVTDKLVFKSLVAQMKEFRPGEIPIIFVPAMEKRDSNVKAFDMPGNTRDISTLPPNPKNYVIMVDRDNEILPSSLQPRNDSREGFVSVLPPEEDPNACYAPNYYPGYIVYDNGTLEYYACIEEAIALYLDVWVLGYEETVSPGNQVMSYFDLGGTSSRKPLEANSAARVNGGPEYGGRIKVTNLGSLESWVLGKPEFKYFVYGASGILLKEFAFGKLRRSNFNGTYIDLRNLIGYWNVANWGSITYEKWIEEDGGGSTSFTTNISYTSNGVTTTTSINTPARNRDINMGTANIQFTDPIYGPIPVSPDYFPSYSFTSMTMQRRDN